MSKTKQKAAMAFRSDNAKHGPVHADRFYSYDELPKSVQRDNDWDTDQDHQYVRISIGRGKKQRYEYIALENFMRLNGGITPAGLKASGFATDSYFSGTALKLLPGRKASDDVEYQCWIEYW